MAQCPLCQRNDVFGEQITYLNIISGQLYFDCPRCGAFRMTSRTHSIVMNMCASDVEGVTEWVLQRNAAGEAPMVSEHLVTRNCRSPEDKVLLR